MDMEPAAVNKSRDKFLFLQVCEVQYSNPSDIFRRVPVAKGDGAGADRLSGYGDLTAGIWPQRAGGLFGAAGKSKEGDPKVKDFKGSSFFVWITPDGHNERMNA